MMHEAVAKLTIDYTLEHLVGKEITQSHKNALREDYAAFE